MPSRSLLGAGGDECKKIFEGRDACATPVLGLAEVPPPAASAAVDAVLADRH